MNRSDDLFPQPGGSPDPYWQRAFEDASDVPPPRVWEGVERQLDLDESDGILPLWQHREGRQSMLFGRWVAGIAASLLLTALGWWAWHREDAIRPDRSMAVAPRSIDRGTASAPGSVDPTGPAVASTERPNVRALSLPRVADGSNVARFGQRADRVAGGSREGTFARGSYLSEGALVVADRAVAQELKKQVPESDQAQEVNGTLVFTETTQSVTIRMKETQSFQSGNQPSTIPRSAVTGTVTMQSFSTQSITGQPQIGQRSSTGFRSTPVGGVPTSEGSISSATSDAPERMAMSGAPLAASPSTLRQQADDRTALATTEEPIAEPAVTNSKKRRQRPWLSAGFVASAYNPTVGLRSAFSPVAASSLLQSVAAGNTPAATPAIQSQAGRAVAFQAGLGIPLGEHWSIETGVGYLSGQNEVQSPVRMASLTSAVKSATADNLYLELIGRLADRTALGNYSAGASYAASDAIRANQASNYASNQQQAVSNMYQFVQVPVQVGYELRPRRKFGLALLTGMVSNWFVRNTVAESITINASDGVYRPVTLAGTAGMRLRYRPDGHWSASIAGTFQQSLQSLTRTDVNLQAQPQQVGLSFSVDRHF